MMNGVDLNLTTDFNVVGNDVVLVAGADQDDELEVQNFIV